MSDAVAKLLPLLDALTPAERAAVVAHLQIDAPGTDDGAEEELTQEEWEAAWAEECERRIADLDSGKTKAMPADEFMRRMREKHG